MRPKQLPPSDSLDPGKASRRRSQSVLGQENDPTAILSHCKDEIIGLWKDPSVREILERRNVCLEHRPGLYVVAASSD